MSRTNIIFISIVVVVVVLIGGTMALLSDPENYKGQISATFEDQSGMELEIRGDMNWRYWPPIALAVNDVVVTPKDSDEPLATITTAAFDMRLIPLILGSNTIPVNGVSLDGLTVNARVDKSGKANWVTEAAEKPAGTTEAEAEAPADSGGSTLGLDVKSIEISDTNISYVDESAGAEYRITMPSLSMGSLRYNEPTQVRFNVLFEDLIAAMKVETSGDGQMVFGQDFSTITMQDLAINETIEMPDMNPIQFDLTVNGTFDTVASKADYTISGTMDNTNISGSVGADLAGKTSVTADLLLDQITLDDYLGEEAEVAEEEEADAPPPEDFEALPLETLRSLNADAKLNIGTLAYDTYRFTDFNAEITNLDSELNADLNMKAYDGTIALKFNGSAADKGAGHTHMSIKDFNVAKFVETDWITGTMAFESNTTFTGSMFSAILDSLDGATTFDIVDGTLDIAPIKSLVVLADQLRGQDSGAGNWPEKMPFKNLAGQHRFNDGTRENQQFNFALEFMKVEGNGGLSYFDEYLAYDLRIQLKEDPDAAYRVPPGLARYTWPISCKGSLDADPIDLCMPNKDTAKDIVEQILKQEAKSSIRKKIEEKVPEGLKGALKGLFDR